MFDSMDARTAFKLGFLTKCAEDGISAEEVAERIEKSAITLTDAFTSTASTLGKVPAALLMGALPVGFGAGYIYSDATAPHVETAEDIKQNELMASYQRAIDRANRVTQRMQQRKSQQPRMPRLPSSVMG
jgi:hypothetical protein